MEKQKRVIFVDDEEIFLKSLKRYFNRLQLDWDIDFFTEPDVALEQISNNSEAVILLDWSMPQMDGIEFCSLARQKASEQNRKLHIIMLTGYIGPDYTVNAFESGADDYLTKPVTMGDLRTHIELGLKTLSSV